MKLGVCAQVLYHLPFREALRAAAELGFEAIELPVDARNPFIDLDAALAGEYRTIERGLDCQRPIRRRIHRIACRLSKSSGRNAWAAATRVLDRWSPRSSRASSA